ncbi:MAG: GNAT family N-acetyltransferase [Acidimicrobiia bacterium]|nr:GNAT family N-acetyltransferase [Acidimicrobiia bacterium]
MTIRSERLLLLPISEGDAESLLGVFQDSAVRRYLLDDAIVSLDWVKHEIASSNERFASTGAGLWAIRITGTTSIVGFVGFREFFDPPRLQLLYGLLPACWGQGLASEAAKVVCDHAFGVLGFSRIEAAMDEPNRRSIVVAERLGLCRLSAPVQTHDATAFYGIDRDTWNQKYRATALSNNGMQPTPQSGAADAGR